MSNISDINPSKSLEPVKKSKVSVRKDQVSSQVSQNKSSEADTVALSSSKDSGKPVKSEAQKVRDWTAQAMNLEDDSSRVEQAKERLASGYYNNPSVLKTVVERMTQDLIGE